QFQAAANFADHLTTRIRATTGWFQAAKKAVQLVKMQVPHVVDVLAADREEQSNGPQPRALAIGTTALHHHFVEPLLHAGARLAALAVAAIMPLDPPRDSVEPDLLALPVLAFHLCVGRKAR